MSDFERTVRGVEPVSEQEGLAAFDLLVPLLVAAPADAEAVEAAAGCVARMPPDAIATAVLDWWLVVEAGASSPLGLAYLLPDAIPSPLRDAMAEVVALSHTDLSVPPARWVRTARSLSDDLAALEPYLILDTYGRTKLPKERDVWAHFQAGIAGTVDALRSGRRTDEIEFDQKEYEKQLKHADVDEGSRRWREMIKRGRACVEQVNTVVQLQTMVEPWSTQRVSVDPVEIPGMMREALGGLVHELLASVTDEDRHSPVLGVQELASRLEAAAAGLDESGLSWLASVADGWLAATHTTVAALRPTIDKRGDLANRISKLQAVGVNTDEIELHLLDHRLSDAEGLARRYEEQRRQSSRAQALATKYERLRAVAIDDHAPSGSVDRLAAGEAKLSRGDVAGAEEDFQALDRDLRAARRSDDLNELEVTKLELEAHDAPLGMTLEIEMALKLLRTNPDRAVDPGLLAGAKERLGVLIEQRRTETARGIAQARALLDAEGSTLEPGQVDQFELRLVDVESALDDGAVMAAKADADDLLAEIEAHRLRRWTVHDGEPALVDHVVDFCTQELHFDPDDVRRLYVAAKTKPFVILAGLTGSGKSTVARLFAGAMGATAVNRRFRRVAVRPDWIDQAEVLGTVNPMSNRFEPGWLAEVARDCEASPDQLFVILLDEMNLAPVEQYLAEYLSALEEARSGAAVTTLPLYPAGAAPENAENWPSTVPFPTNLILVGTVNVDETTRALSDRVLDRANVLQLSVAISDAHHRRSERSVRPWSVGFDQWRQVCADHPDDGHHEFLVDIGEILQGVGIGVGQRAHVELERFIANAAGILDPEVSLDLGVLQRIIPKIRGFKRDLSKGLTELREELDHADCPRSVAVLDRWLDDTTPDDEYLDGTDARIGLLG